MDLRVKEHEAQLAESSESRSLIMLPLNGRYPELVDSLFEAIGASDSDLTVSIWT